MRNMVVSLLLVIVMLILTGCTVLEEPINMSSMPPAMNSTNNSNMTNGSSASAAQRSVDAALMWSEKYEKLITEFETVKKKNESYHLNNVKLQEEITKKDKELALTRKELDEANEILLSMRLELSQWKKDVLGFREEMRNSQKALLAASAKILRELGAEIRDPVEVDGQVAKND